MSAPSISTIDTCRPNGEPKCGLSPCGSLSYSDTDTLRYGHGGEET